MESHDSLKADHTPEAIAKRIRGAAQHSYLGDGVLGAIDGTVTTFAIVAASSGAGFGSGVALVLGFANVCADGFSMAASNYLRAKSDEEVVKRARDIEAHHIETIPDGEREEIRQIFARKGFEGEALERAVDVITSDVERWVDTMITDEYGLALQGPSPWRAALTTLLAFIIVGFLPLAAFVLDWTTGMRLFALDPFLASVIMTAFAFVIIGGLKSRFVAQRWFWASLETLAVGACAAALAYGIGYLLRGLAGP